MAPAAALTELWTHVRSDQELDYHHSTEPSLNCSIFAGYQCRNLLSRYTNKTLLGTGKREIKAAFCCVLRIKVVFAVLWRKVAAAPTAADYRLTTYLMSATVSAAANLQICLQLHLWTFIPLYLGQVTAASSSRDGVFSVYG